MGVRATRNTAPTLSAAAAGELLARHWGISGGLYLGGDLVRDPVARTPAGREAPAISERMRELGVIVQPTGDHGNVLKVKPPLCVTTDHADHFAESRDRALTELEVHLPPPMTTGQMP